MDKKISWNKWFDFVRGVAIQQEIQGEQLAEFLKEEYQYYQKEEDRIGTPIDRRMTEDEFVNNMTQDIEAQKAVA